MEVAPLDLKETLAKKAQGNKYDVKLSKNMSIPDIVRALEPEIKKALPSVLTPERFIRIALSALNNNPKLEQCTPMSFIGALLNAAQLGLEPNSPLGQSYLIPYRNNEKGVLECQFQIGYKGLIDLAYRTGQVLSIQAHTVYEGDIFEFAYGLNPVLEHKPTFSSDKPTYYYAVFHTINKGYGFEVMNKTKMDQFANEYSKSIDSNYSIWKKNYNEMAKKTVIKTMLKYAPIQSSFQRALSNDETIKTHISEDMSEVSNEMD